MVVVQLATGHASGPLRYLPGDVSSFPRGPSGRCGAVDKWLYVWDCPNNGGSGLGRHDQLRWLRHDIDFRDRQAARHAGRHDELLEEKTTRDEMPTAQASLEAMWRTSWAIEQHRRDAEAAEREDAEISHRYTLDREMGLIHDHDHSYDQGQGHHHGFGLEL